MTARLRLLIVLTAAAALIALLAVVFHDSRPAPGPVSNEIVATLRGEPKTFNRYVDASFPTHLVCLLTQAPLVRINRVTQEVEPYLAKAWTVAGDGRTWTLELRDDVAWSDGTPFTADDVLFSVRAAEQAEGSRMKAMLRVAGAEPPSISADGPHRIVLTFPFTYAAGVRMLASLPIYPRHALAAALDDGSFASAWGTGTDREAMPGLGPFLIESYTPNQRVTFARNPRFWRTGPAGERLPRVDRLVLQIVADQDAELLRLTAGQADLLQSEVRAEDYRMLKAEADAGRLRLVDAGLSYDRFVLWFNLGATPEERSFLGRDEFRRAVSVAVDRRAFADSVYLGAAEPAPYPVSPSNLTWVATDLPSSGYDPAEASRLLDGLGLRDRDGDGIRDDQTGRPVRFTLLVQAGVTAGEKGAQFVRDALAQVGVGIDVVALDVNTLMTRWLEADYDAIYHFLIATDTDPAANLDWWLSSGSSHVWAPARSDPTAWEVRIDELMRQQIAANDLAERQRLFAEVQRIFATHNPAIFFVAPHVYVASSRRLEDTTPAIQRPQLLWNAEALMVESAGR